MNRRTNLIIVSLVGTATLLGGLSGQTSRRGEKRARHPSFDKVPSGIFFDDAFREGLIGPRPVADTTPIRTEKRGSKVAAKPTDSSKFAWSEIISAATIEDEIKTIKRQLDEALFTAGHFKGRGYKQARTDLTVAAMLFAVIDQYDAEVRWKKSAAVARDRMSRAASNAKVGTTSVYQEAKQRQLDFQDLIRGAALTGNTLSDDGLDWAEVCDRVPLMKRLDQSQQERLSVWVASETEFANHKDSVVREAELVATMAEVLTRDGMEDADDEDYTSYSRRLREAALNIVNAVKRDDYEAARQAAGEIRKSCSDCHERYKA